jgi:hypothetical protein
MSLPPLDAHDWETLGGVAPDALSEARLQLHWAANLAAAPGASLGEPAPDDSHASLEWTDAGRVLAGTPVGGLRAALRPDDPALVLLDDAHRARESFPLEGKTLPEALRWLRSGWTAASGRPTAAEIALPRHELPAHPVGGEARFSFADATLPAELGRWFAVADRVLRSVRAGLAGTSPVRCWPHHFDIAVLVTVGAAEEDRPARTVGVGMTPGDGGYPEPYWYVTPWPYPEDPALPCLDGEGSWHTTGWTGAVLTGSRLVAAGDAASQAERLSAFLGSAVDACVELAGGRLSDLTARD